MRLGLLISTLVLAGASLAHAQDWFEFIDRAERFTVNLPGKPAQRDITYAAEEGGKFPAKVYTVSEGPNRYSVTVVNFRGADPRIIRGSIAYEAWNFRKRGGTITYDAFAQIDRIEGHQLQITNTNKTRTFVAIHLHAGRLYILEATVPQDALPPADFQQSLTILDEAGTRVRYELDAEGNRARRVPAPE